MLISLAALLDTLRSIIRSRLDVQLENLALRHQIGVLHRSARERPKLTSADRLLWICLSRLWRDWRSTLVIVKPETIVAWHRKGFRLFWTWKVRRGQPGRPVIARETRDLIRKMCWENPGWGAPRIHGELLKLGFPLSETTVLRWLRRLPRTPDPVKRWLAFLRNHREAIAAMDFFTVPTLTFGVLYCFFVIGHDRRKILRFSVTRNPNALWVVQQLREAWAYKQPHRFWLFDRDSKFGTDVISAVRDLGSQPTRTAFRSLWQNGVAERWVGSCRRDLLDHVIVLKEQHLQRLMSQYVLYYHEDRTHLGLAKDTPAGRPTAIGSGAESKIYSFLDSVDCTIVTPSRLSSETLSLGYGPDQNRG